MEEGTANFLLRCSVRGTPRPRVTWNVRGRIVRGGENPKYGVTDDGLVLYNVTREDQGNYKCKATQIEEGITDFRDMVIDLRVQRE